MSNHKGNIEEIEQGDFSTLAEHYHNRPAYSSMLLEKLIKLVNINNKTTMDVAEVGAGTGKMTKMLSNFGLRVKAVEPNVNMMEEGKKYTINCNNIEWIKGDAHNTTLDSNSFDWVLMASSFHWSDPKFSLKEFSRILKDGGSFTAIWNPRNIIKGSIFDDIEEGIKQLVPELKRVSSGKSDAPDYNQILVSTGHFKDSFLMECDYIEMMHRDRYLGIWKSVNDIQAQAGDRWKDILTMIEQKTEGMDIIEVPYKIRAWTAQKI